VAGDGIHKAAVLLMSLDQATAAELLRSVSPEKMAEIAAEVACLNASGFDRNGEESEAPTREFYSLLSRRRRDRDQGDAFVESLLRRAVGDGQSREVMGRVKDLVQVRDPFMPIRSANVPDIAEALKGEPAQVAAIVLAELPPRKSAELIPRLADDVRAGAVRGMALGRQVLPEARRKVGETIVRRLVQMNLPTDKPRQVVVRQATREEQLRKVALLLRGLEKELRDSLVAGIAADDKASGALIQKLMVTWQDIPVLPDRALQEVLRTVDTRKLALALNQASAATVRKVRENISARASAMLDEEASLLSSPKPEDVEAAREAILTPLRELNAKGELQFVEEEE